MHLDVQSLLDLNVITYRGEGNNTIAVSNSTLGIILRIRKTNNSVKNRHSKLPSSDVGVCNRLEELHANQRIHLYFGHDFVRDIYLVKTDPSFLIQLENKISPARPAYRTSKGIDHSESCVFVTADATKIPVGLEQYGYGPVLSIEIKPKFGVILLWPATGLVNLAKNFATLFCLRQHHASKLNRWKGPSLYCPCDLFSGDRARLIRGLNALLVTPQNNFRVYLDSQLIYSHDSDDLEAGLDKFFSAFRRDCGYLNGFSRLSNERNSTEKFSTFCSCNHNNGNSNCTFFANNRDRLIRGLLCEALLYEFESNNLSLSKRLANCPPLSFSCRLHPWSGNTAYPSNCSECTQSDTVPKSSSRVSTVPDKSILGRVLSVQLLSSSDICFITPIYERVRTYLDSYDWTWDMWLKASSDENSIYRRKMQHHVSSFDLLENYLNSLVARDCSIMITIQHAKPGCPSSVSQISDQHSCLPSFIFDCVVIDLDPKPLDSIRDRQSVEASVTREALQRQQRLLFPDVLSSSIN